MIQLTDGWRQKCEIVGKKGQLWAGSEQERVNLVLTGGLAKYTTRSGLHFRQVSVNQGALPTLYHARKMCADVCILEEQKNPPTKNLQKFERGIQENKVTNILEACCF